MPTLTAPRGPTRRKAAAAAMSVACLIVATPAAAQEGEDSGGDAQTWSVQPAGKDGADGRPSYDYSLPAGASITDHAQINNFSQQPLTLRVYSHDAINTPSGGFTLLPSDEPPADVGAWIGLDEEVTVPAEDSVVVPFTLTVPDNATPGDHPGGIVASLTREGTDAEGNPVLVDHRVGARIYLRVNGDLNPALQVVGLTTTYSRSLMPFSLGRVTVTYQLRNTGNTRLRGQQTVKVSGLFGLGDRSLTLATVPEILPGQTIAAGADIAGVWPLVRLSTDLTVEPEPPPRFGQDPNPPAVSASTTTWALPWPELSVLLLAGLVVWLAVAQRRRRKERTAATFADAIAKAREEGRKEAAATATDGGDQRA
jgi:hypothetical protein